MDGRDYSRPGWYFVTLCADYQKMLFGRIEGVCMRPNALGALVERCWAAIPAHYGHVPLGEWQLMPNHFHGLLCIRTSGGKGLGEVLNMFKGSVTREWRKQLRTSRLGEKGRAREILGEEERVWQPNYWDVICFEPEQLAIREAYVKANPRRWGLKKVPQGTHKRSRFRGNLSLLEALPRRSLRVSRRCTEAELDTLKAELEGFEGVVFSTFFSPGERVCRDLLLKGNTQIVWVLPMAMPKRIPVAWTDAFLQGRTLWLSAFEETEPTRTNCELANEWVKRYCAAVARHGELKQNQSKNESKHEPI